MTPREAAEAAGVDRMTILRWIRAGKLAATPVRTRNGPGYDIRPEDLEQAKRAPRKKRDPREGPPAGSVAELVDSLRRVVEAQAAELHELRGELHAMHEQVLRALPAPKPRRRLWPFGGRKEGEK